MEKDCNFIFTAWEPKKAATTEDARNFELQYCPNTGDDKTNNSLTIEKTIIEGKLFSLMLTERNIIKQIGYWEEWKYSRWFTLSSINSNISNAGNGEARFPKEKTYNTKMPNFPEMKTVAAYVKYLEKTRKKELQKILFFFMRTQNTPDIINSKRINGNFLDVVFN